MQHLHSRSTFMAMQHCQNKNCHLHWNYDIEHPKLCHHRHDITCIVALAMQQMGFFGGVGRDWSRFLDQALGSRGRDWAGLLAHSGSAASHDQMEQLGSPMLPNTGKPYPFSLWHLASIESLMACLVCFSMLHNAGKCLPV